MRGHQLLGWNATGDVGTTLATPFEAWCEQRGVHPEHWAAWPAYEAEQRDRLDAHA